MENVDNPDSDLRVAELPLVLVDFLRRAQKELAVKLPLIDEDRLKVTMGESG